MKNNELSLYEQLLIWEDEQFDLTIPLRVISEHLKRWKKTGNKFASFVMRI